MMDSPLRDRLFAARSLLEAAHALAALLWAGDHDGEPLPGRITPTLAGLKAGVAAMNDDEADEFLRRHDAVKDDIQGLPAITWRHAEEMHVNPVIHLLDESAMFWAALAAAGDPPGHPLGPVIRAFLKLPGGLGEAHVIVTRGPRDLLLSRLPGWTALAVTRPAIEVIAVDGEPLATALPDGRMKRERAWKLPEPLPGEKLPGPRTIDGRASAGAIFMAAADMALGGDERSPLRSDIMRGALTATALTRAVTLTEAEGAVFIGGADTPANRRRFNEVMQCLRYMSFEAKPGIRWHLIDAEAGKVNTLGPPRWWLATDSGSRTCRLSGGLFRLATRWGALERTVAGLEGMLTWGPAGPHGRRTNAENCYPCNRSVVSPIYPVAQRGEAPAGDTVEIVRQIAGQGRGQTAGLIIRAAARFCAAYAGEGRRERLPATRILRQD